jgi:hypothetical protein
LRAGYGSGGIKESDMAARDRRIVARIEPSGLAFGKPKGELREMREPRSRVSLSLNPGYGYDFFAA